MTKRQTASSRERAPELEANRAAVAGDTIATATRGEYDGFEVANVAPALTEEAPSVAQMVREAMTAGVTDRDMILTRVQQYRPDTTRQTVARAMQRHVSKHRVTEQGQYL
ncbi:hypothetical protein G3M53_74920 [Streptomyces sp. SID7982]|nr:hypothetical protein [Streptomyces sp. SID7982]